MAMRSNRGMIEMLFPLVPELSVTALAPNQVGLVEQLATLRLENGALHNENAGSSCATSAISCGVASLGAAVAPDRHLQPHAPTSISR
jgi:hypothetical protein